jgi:hypothetical protein
MGRRDDRARALDADRARRACRVRARIDPARAKAAAAPGLVVTGTPMLTSHVAARTPRRTPLHPNGLGLSI